MIAVFEKFRGSETFSLVNLNMVSNACGISSDDSVNLDSLNPG